MSSSEVQLTESTPVVSSQDASVSAGETGSALSSSDKQTEDGINVTSLPDANVVTEAVADSTVASSEEKPSADDGNAENSCSCKANGNEERSTPEKADSDSSAQCGRMATPKSRGGRSYQESRRSKKTGGELKSVPGSSKSDRTRDVVDVHSLDVRCLEQKGKGDVRDSGMQEDDSLRRMKDSLCHPTCGGDQPALVNVIIDEHDMRKRFVIIS